MIETHLYIENLPPSVQKQIYDYWEFLSNKYSSDKKEKPLTKESANREEVLERLNFLSSLISNPTIKEPTSWQKNIRTDRKLSGRDH